MDTPILYGYWRSSSAYRVRIAVSLKGIEPLRVFGFVAVEDGITLIVVAFTNQPAKDAS